MVRNAKNEHRTDKSHYPSTKNITQEGARYREQMEQVGAGTVDFLEVFKDTEMYKCHHYRSIAGILALRKKYGNEVLDQACRRACHYGNIT